MYLGRPIFLLVLVILGGVGGYLFGQSKGQSDIANSLKDSLKPIEEQGTSFSFIHPLLAYRVPEASVFGDYMPLKTRFQSIIDEKKKAGKATRISLYFRDLTAARWVGVGEADTYHPASLLKVPIMIAYYKQAEMEPALFSEIIAYDPNVMPKDPYLTASALIPGHAYSVMSLINSMIVYSDNGATFTLLNHMNEELLHSVYISLGIQDPVNESNNYQISTRTYGLFFRILYNATYLSQQSSEATLKLLTQTKFTDGLVAGVPKGTSVAHKFGEHVLASNGEGSGVELSDCGIVYYPEHPYLLCVMTTSTDQKTASSIIAELSEAAYQGIENQYSN